jgi:hypothetical protein
LQGKASLVASIPVIPHMAQGTRPAA